MADRKMWKIQDLMLYGFTKDEMSKIREHVGGNCTEEVTSGFVQECCDLIGEDISLLITPDCAGLICMRR